MRRLTIATVLTLMGCAATGQWVHPSRTDAGASRDWNDCKATAAQYSRDLGFADNAYVVDRETERCMTTLGWKQK